MKCKNCGKQVVTKVIRTDSGEFEFWVHKKIDMEISQMFDPNFDFSKVCMDPQPKGD